jgi:hypothetical protein
MKNKVNDNQSKATSSKPGDARSKVDSVKKETVKLDPKAKIKGKQIVEIVEEVKPPPPKEKIIERFIVITTYNDIETMKTLTELFEAINKEAFGLQSNKDIYNRMLTEEEQEGYMDYITGFQLLDNTIRFTILEGIAGKGMKLVRERIPKLNINSNKFKIFANSSVLFETRLYAKFGLCLKFIKLRSTLNEILTTPDIYLKAAKCRDIYNCFLNLGFILNASELRSIAENRLFPNADHLLLLERKYADILTDEDLTGIKVEKRVKKKRAVTGLTTNTLMSTSVNNKSYKTLNISIQKDLNSSNNISYGINSERPMVVPESLMKKKVDSYNYNYFKYKESQLFKTVDTHGKNLDLIKTLNEKANTNKFIKNDVEGTVNKNSVYIYGNHTKNHYNEIVEKMRQEYAVDKNSYYTYSKDYLMLNFPIIKSTSEYDDYAANKQVIYI